MADVFISYKREDRQVVEFLTSILTDLGLDVWYDWALEVGEDWGARIMREAQSASAVVVCWAPEACISTWVLREAEMGRSRGVLVPLMVRRCEIPDNFSTLQTADLTGWKGEIADPRFQQLLPKLEKLTHKENLAKNGRLRAGGQHAELVAMLRALLVARVRAKEKPLTYQEAEDAIRRTAEVQNINIGDFAQPSLWGALDEIAEQNRRHREPPLFAMVVGPEYGLPGRGYFQKHVFLIGSHDSLEQKVFERHLERVYKFPWSRDP